ncbi:MAG TPA: hypothetical protein VIJ52_08175 [Pseudolabrys sp.]
MPPFRTLALQGGEHVSGDGWLRTELGTDALAETPSGVDPGT